MTEIKADKIEVEEVIRSKNPRLLKLIPRFVISYLKKVIHQKQINEALERYKDFEGVDFIENFLRDFGANINVINPENIPATGRYLLASNHPLGGLDGMALLLVVGKVRSDIIFPVNDILLNLRNLRKLFLPINKHGNNIENKKIIDDTFASGIMILYFPSGLCSRKQKGAIIDLPWKNTFIKKAIQFERDIIPVHIDGRNSNFFYNLANWRKRLGIKGNIEMLYLVDEMYKQHNKDINITFGKPVSFKVFNNKCKSNEWAQKMKDHTYALGKDSKKEFIVEIDNKR